MAFSLLPANIASQRPGLKTRRVGQKNATLFLMHTSWKLALAEEFQKPYYKDLEAFLARERKLGKVIFPAEENIFQALSLTPLDQVKVVILGQDPYHGDGQAHGLAFSVQPGVKLPPSLQNIFKELQSDVGLSLPSSGHLGKWAQEGVLLINNVLTVERGAAASHQGKGWEQFTDRIIQILLSQKKHLVFILWGSPAQKKASMVNGTEHLIIASPHPSPLSSYRGFFGSRPFSRTNDYLKAHGKSPINWQL